MLIINTVTKKFFRDLNGPVPTNRILRTLTEFERDHLFDIAILEKAYKKQGIKGELLENVKKIGKYLDKDIYREDLKELMLPKAKGGRRTRGKKRTKSRKKRRKSRRKSRRKKRTKKRRKSRRRKRR